VLLLRSTALLLLLSVVGCSQQEIKHPYQQAESQPRMQVPDGYDSQAIVDYYPVPSIEGVADDDFIYRLPLPTPVVGDKLQHVRLQALGDTLWLAIRVSPSQLWPRLQQFIVQKQWRIQSESGNNGILAVEDTEQGVFYRFRVSQGFQRKASELSLRYLTAARPESWPAESSDIEKERETLTELAVFLADSSVSASYSYVAQGISTQEKMQTLDDPEGVKSLLLLVDRKRALASIKQSLEAASFLVESTDAQSGSIVARYMPQLAEDDQPGWFLRMFGVKRKAYDKDVEYAGNHYKFVVLAQGEGQLLSISSDQQWPTPRRKRNELNAMMRLLQGSMN
jgi:outer membrane protein assembly factor BamC